MITEWIGTQDSGPITRDFGPKTQDTGPTIWNLEFKIHDQDP